MPNLASSRSRSSPRAIDVPFSLLLTNELTPAAKLLWIRLRFDEQHPRQRSHRPHRLAQRTSLARSTIYAALRQAVATGWLRPYRANESGRRRWKTICPVQEPRGFARIPVDLIRAAHALRPQAILCYGLLQATANFNVRGRTGSFKWAELRELAGLHLRTIKRAVRALAEARWIATAQENRLAPIWFRLQHADAAFLDETKKRLETSLYLGEALMRSFLSLIADTQECEDGARPEFLVNPATGERMELDRYYPVHRVAFEFNGKQHYTATGPFTKEEVAAQQKRDRLKRRICAERSVELVPVHAQDLSLAGMLKKVEALLPRRNLRGFKRTIRFLNGCGLRYRAAAESG